MVQIHSGTGMIFSESSKKLLIRIHNTGHKQSLTKRQITALIQSINQTGHNFSRDLIPSLLPSALGHNV